jgi:cytochrome bd-type quinol oxidase subunit 2
MSSEFKVVVALLFIGIVASLGRALFHMSSGEGDSGQMARALTMRISLSVALFLVITIAWYLGLISPHAGPLGSAGLPH